MAVLWISANDTSDPTGPFTDWAVRTASWILYKLTAEKYSGIQTTTDWYSLDSSGTLQYRPEIINGEMHNLPAGLSASSNTQLRLRRRPVLTVSEIYSGGILVPFEEYELRNNAFVVRKDKLPWVASPLSELSVTYTHGSPPPVAGKRAAVRLANELILAEKGDAMCALPDSVTSINRQGISYTLLDPQVYIEKGRTGVYEIDMFIYAANPRGALKKPGVFIAGRSNGEKIN
jgi:hypothetical protein